MSDENIHLYTVPVQQVFNIPGGHPQLRTVNVTPTGEGVLGFGADKVPLFLELGDNLSITDGVLNASGGGGGGDATLAGNNVFTGDNTFEGTTAFTDDVTAEEIDADVINAGAIALNGAPGTDDTYSGLTITGKNAGATIAQWEVVYMGASFQWLLADSNGANTYPAAGVAVAAGTSGNPLTVLTRGVVRNDAWNWSVGRIYLSTTAGGLTQTPPATTGDKVQDVGFALSADVAFLDFNGTYLTVA